jgi:regulator of cell morphogenesis and NO signaling
MENLASQKIGELVAEDYRKATIFKKYGMDFCCGGNKTITEVCKNKGISLDKVIEDLDNLSENVNEQSVNYASWPLDLLADYIEKKHHRYVENTTQSLIEYLNKICKVHGSNHPELFVINEEFNASAKELAAHMKREELILFPFIRKMVTVKNNQQQLPHPGFGTVKNPIQMMMEQHDIEGERFRKIAGLCNNYTPPADACNTYSVTLSLLKEFENDLHLHIHLENNILFPKALLLESELVE